MNNALSNFNQTTFTFLFFNTVGSFLIFHLPFFISHFSFLIYSLGRGSFFASITTLYTKSVVHS